MDPLLEFHMPPKPKPTPEQLAWLDQCEPVLAIKIRDMGLPMESNHPVDGADSLLDLFEGIDEEGRAL